jgi:pilus assembly protein CpaB
MSARTLIIILLALACGGTAATVANELRKQAAAAAEVQTEPVVTAADTLERGSIISEASVTVEQWPKGFAPPGALTDKTTAIDRTAVARIVKGEPLFVEKLAEKGSAGSLASMIPRGMRAFTILAQHESTGVGGFLLPGDDVDVLLTTTTTDKDTTGGAATTTLLQNVRVLAVGTNLDAPDSRKMDSQTRSSVTLLVTPSQAAKLDLGATKGTLHFSLRHPDDHVEADVQPAMLSQLRFQQERPNATTQFLGETLTAIANVMSKRMIVEPVVVADAADKANEAPTTTAQAKSKRPARAGFIRTFRGVQSGHVRVDF